VCELLRTGNCYPVPRNPTDLGRLGIVSKKHGLVKERILDNYGNLGYVDGSGRL
jgi:hypothetical protein